MLIRCGGEAAFIDSGSHTRGVKCAEYLLSAGVTRLKYYIGTHAHTDHVGGAPAILIQVPAEEILTNYSLAVTAMRDSAYNAEERAVIDNTPMREVKMGDEFYIGDARLTCVGPSSITRWAKYTDGNENSNSLIFRLEYGAHSFLFTADTTNDVLKGLLKEDPELLTCTVVKGPHHEVGMEEEVLKYLNCEYFVFSTSTDDPPASYKINNVRRTGARVFITNYNNAGTVVFYTDGQTMTHTTQYSLDRIKLGVTDGITLRVGKSKSIEVSLKPSRMLNTLHWTSSDTAVATVDPCTGKVTAAGEGQCVIRATGFDDSYSEFTVTVKPRQ